MNREEKLLLISYSLLLLIGLGLMLEFSLSGVKKGIFERQASWAMLGIMAMLWIWRTDEEWVLGDRMVWILYLLSIVGLLLVFTPLGVEINRARRWIWIGPIHFQPSEFVKFFVLPSISKVLSESRGDGGLGTTILGLILLAPVIALVGAEPDIGFILMILLVFCAMSFVAGISVRNLLLLVLVTISISSFLLLLHPDRIGRITDFIRGSSYHVDRARMAVGSGGLDGVGIGDSWFKYRILPYPYSDSVFSILAEEFGFIGIVAVVLLYLVMVRTGFSIALAQEGFRRILGVGISSTIGIQVLLSMGIGCGILPPKGLTLPFISCGGSSLLSTSMAIGILLSISRAAGWSGRR